ncbi:MAG: hypothetical protein RLZ04_489 [Actinomycetota bacterium]|jgi:uncharacterized protein
MAHPLLVNAVEILRRPGTERDLEAEILLADLEVDDPDRFAEGAVAVVRLHLESLSDGVVVDGTVRVAWHGTCRRCLEPTGGVQESEVHELYQKVLTDPDAFEIGGDQLDLRPVVREIVLLDAPSTPLCRPDCPGLCPSCGTSLAESTCACTAPPADPRWAALEGLRLDDLDGDTSGA